MARTLSVCALLIVFPCAARADEPLAPIFARLKVTPQAVPTPALRYQLLPELREMNPGNPVQGFLDCFMEQNNFFFGKDEVDKRDKWLTMPLKDLPLKELRGYGGAALRQADFAARLDKPDWQILLKMRRDGFNTLLPDVQEMRRLADALKVRFRAEVAERRFEDALVTAKTMFALSRCLGQHPTLERRSGGRGRRVAGHQPAGGNDPATGLPEPLLGAGRPARPVPRPARVAAGRTRHDLYRISNAGREKSDERSPAESGVGSFRRRLVSSTRSRIRRRWIRRRRRVRKNCATG